MLLTALLSTFSLRELLHHPWRSGAAVVAVMLGVALAFAVHVINASALAEFGSALRAVNGQADVELHAGSGALPQEVLAWAAARPEVALASAVVDVTVQARDASGARKPLRVLGVDALVVAAVSPALMPRVDAAPANDQTKDALALGNSADEKAVGDDRFAVFAPNQVFLNAAAAAQFGSALQSPGTAPAQASAPDPAATQALDKRRPSVLQIQHGTAQHSLRIAGSVAATGAPLAVMDIGAAQELLGRLGFVSRIDLRLQPGSDGAALRDAAALLPGGVQARSPSDSQERMGALSRAYRVNMTVLALVAMFTGAFLVYSVLALSVAKRVQQFALLGVLGLNSGQRMWLVLLESALLGAVGAVLGIALGTGLAALALSFLGGDLGGGYFAGVSPKLHWSAGAAALYAALGVGAACVGGWQPAQRAARLPLAASLKGLGAVGSRAGKFPIGIVLIAASALLALTPPVFSMPLGAYMAIGLLLLGGIASLPFLVGFLLNAAATLLARAQQPRPLVLLALERARRVAGSAAVAVSGVVAALSLAVALTVMVASFRGSVTAWLDVVLPAPLYVRSSASAAAGQAGYFRPDFVQKALQIKGIARITPLRNVSLQLDPARPAVALVVRPIANAARDLPLVSGPFARPADAPPDAIALYVSEAMVDLYGAAAGALWSRELPLFKENTANVSVIRSYIATNTIVNSSYYVAGVWRDYARQFGSIAMDSLDYQRLTGDVSANDLSITPTDGADMAAIEAALRALAAQQDAAIGAATASAGQTAGASADQTAAASTGAAASQSANLPAGNATASAASNLEFASADQIRAITLRIFDRSFAVTYWLQAVAIGIGLFGVAASFSAQVLARRKEFGLLAHLGLTRRQILQLVAAEGLAWTTLGALAGLGLGLLVSLILVHVVNPQSFHWTMDMATPWPRLAALCIAVVAAGTLTAWLSGRAAAGRDAVLAVKEDW